MASLYKPAVSTYRLPDGKHRTPDGNRVTKYTPGAIKVSRKSEIWYGKYKSAGGILRRVPLCSDKTASKQMLAKMVTDAALARVNLTSCFEDHHKRPLADHLADFERGLIAKGSTIKQVRLKIGRIRKLIHDCGFAFIADLSASRVQEYIGKLRQQGRPVEPLDEGKQSYTKLELAMLLRVTPSAIPPVVRRHRLKATGKGKARRFPYSTALFLWSRMNRGRGAQTASYYLREIKSFSGWLVRDRRTPDNPLGHLQVLAAPHDRRRDRRPLALEELRAVIEAAMQSGTVFRGIAGRDRAILYAVAVASGFRASELASLRVGSFDLDSEPPIVTLAGEQAKNGKTAIQPLPPDLVAHIRFFLKGKSDDHPIWPGSWPERAAEMFRADLQAAGISYVVDGPNGDLFADFHSLRHSFVASLDMTGASLKQAMQLARHSNPKLTMARYGRAQLYDLGEAVGRLPSLFSGPEDVSEVCRATGTDGGCAVDRALTAPMRIPAPSLRIAEKTSPTRVQNTAGHNPLGIQGVEAGCDSMNSIDKTSGGWDRTTDTRLMKPLL